MIQPPSIILAGTLLCSVSALAGEPSQSAATPEYRGYGSGALGPAEYGWPGTHDLSMQGKRSISGSVAYVNPRSGEVVVRGRDQRVIKVPFAPEAARKLRIGDPITVYAAFTTQADRGSRGAPEGSRRQTGPMPPMPAPMGHYGPGGEPSPGMGQGRRVPPMPPWPSSAPPASRGYPMAPY
jgi:hypothetical protein